MALEDKIDALIASVDALTAAMTGGGAKPPAKSTGSKPAASGSSKPKAASKPKGPKLEDLTKLAGAMLKGDTGLDGDDAKAALKSFRDNFGCKPSEVDEDRIAEAMEALTALSEGEDPFGEGGDEGDEDATDMV